MQKEKLVCQSCQKEWERTSSRGRKPKLCPSCLSSPEPVVATTNAKPSPSSADSRLFRAPSKWACSSCGASVKIEIDMKYPPTHRCKKKLERVLPLELIK